MLDQLRARIRARHFSMSTEKTYVGWARRFITHVMRKGAKAVKSPLD